MLVKVDTDVMWVKLFPLSVKREILIIDLPRGLEKYLSNHKSKMDLNFQVPEIILNKKG